MEKGQLRPEGGRRNSAARRRDHRRTAVNYQRRLNKHGGHVFARSEPICICKSAHREPLPYIGRYSLSKLIFIAYRHPRRKRAFLSGHEPPVA
ncbi:unnamed protein product [Caenorhabditis auriculariae]|uniref:Uncharacterized protein n=1 Tax=Caenorhabditis auriculariae TaxID=2777116 RepID=A0A8S1HD66_9PELO|nr:unnamed protein product [Caenorhabditis auriculariae]